MDLSQLRKQYYWKNISLTLNSKAICKIFNIQTYRNVSNPWSPWPRQTSNERIDANKIFPTNQVNLDLFSSNGNLNKINVADQESNVTMVSFSGSDSNSFHFKLFYLFTFFDWYVTDYNYFIKIIIFLFSLRWIKTT